MCDAEPPCYTVLDKPPLPQDKAGVPEKRIRRGTDQLLARGDGVLPPPRRQGGPSPPPPPPAAAETFNFRLFARALNPENTNGANPAAPDCWPWAAGPVPGEDAATGLWPWVTVGPSDSSAV